MKLTKEQTIKEHRKMWNWIAKQYKNGINADVYDLKHEYLENKFPNQHIKYNCFCCDYTYDDYSKHCENCPLKWIDSDGNLTNDCYHCGCLYYKIKKNSEKCYENKENIKKCLELAKKIANLEKKENNK